VEGADWTYQWKKGLKSLKKDAKIVSDQCRKDEKWFILRFPVKVWTSLRPVLRGEACPTGVAAPLTGVTGMAVGMAVVNGVVAPLTGGAGVVVVAVVSFFYGEMRKKRRDTGASAR
jgi:hypothetical protein